jgi:hypothetical protein
MSYYEYFDMFHEVQKIDNCPYRAFMFDVINSRNQADYCKFFEKHHECMEYVYTLLEREEQLVGTKILLKDKNNKHQMDMDSLRNGNLRNPMRLGDMVTYFVYNGSITIERMIELFSEGLNKYKINYPFHFATGVYQTNDYGQGDTLLYKGYMPQILENLSKRNGIIIDCDSHTNTAGM